MKAQVKQYLSRSAYAMKLIHIYHILLVNALLSGHNLSNKLAYTHSKDADQSEHLV